MFRSSSRVAFASLLQSLGRKIDKQGKDKDREIIRPFILMAVDPFMSDDPSERISFPSHDVSDTFFPFPWILIKPPTEVSVALSLLS